MVRIHKCSKQKESCAIIISPKTFEYFKYEIYSGLKIFSEQIYIAYYFALCFEDSNVAIIGSESLFSPALIKMILWDYYINIKNTLLGSIIIKL